MTTACQVGGPGTPYVIPGPTAPTAVTSGPPFVWQSIDELEAWRTHPASRGPATVVNDGLTTFIRVSPASSPWVLRGPDLSPPATAVRTLRFRYRWRPDPDLDRNASRTGYVYARFERAPATSHQPTAYAILQPASAWTDVDLVAGDFGERVGRALRLPPLGSASIAASCEIARIELVP